MRANYQYHSGGVSSGRCPMSYVYDAWSSTLQYKGEQLDSIETPLLMKELKERTALMSPERIAKPATDLTELDITELTELTVNAMLRGHEHMKKAQDWVFSEAESVVRAVQQFFGKELSAKLQQFLPEDMYEKQNVASPAHYPPLKSLVDELEARHDQFIIDQKKGLVPGKITLPFD